MIKRVSMVRRRADMTPEMALLLSLTLRCRSDKAARELGYHAVPLQTMFEDCYRWMVAEGMIPPAPTRGRPAT